jgi:hypothetical protein
MQELKKNRLSAYILPRARYETPYVPYSPLGGLFLLNYTTSCSEYIPHHIVSAGE